MRAFSVCLVLVVFVAMQVGTTGNPVGDNAVLTFEAADKPITLFDVDAQQEYENEGDRLARGYRGGYGGGCGGYRGGYGGYRGGYGGYRGGYGRYSGRRGGYYG